MKRLIPNTALKLKDVPEPDASWYAIEEFALTYDGYQDTGSFEACAEIARERRHETLDDLRACLFFEQRSAHHGGRDPEGGDLNYVRGLIRQIRERVRSQKMTASNGLPSTGGRHCPAFRQTGSPSPIAGCGRSGETRPGSAEVTRTATASS